MREKPSEELARAPVSITKETKAALDSIKHPGQSYDGIIRELIQLYKERENKGVI